MPADESKRLQAPCEPRVDTPGLTHIEPTFAQFSSRRAQINKLALALAEEYERERGHAPDQRALASMRQFANARLLTRADLELARRTALENERSGKSELTRQRLRAAAPYLG